MDETKHIGKEINKVSLQIRRAIDHSIQQFGVSGMQASMLGYINRQSEFGEVYQTDIEKEFKIRRSSVTNAMQCLENDGMILRVSADSDARKKKVIVTPKADAIHLKVRIEIDKIENKFREKLSDEEVDIFFTILEKISREIND